MNVFAMFGKRVAAPERSKPSAGAALVRNEGMPYD